MRVIASGQLSVAHSPRRRPQGQAPSLVDTAVQRDGTFRADAPLSLRRLVEVGALRTRLARRLPDPALSRDVCSTALSGQPTRSVGVKRYHIAGGGADPADPLTSTRRNDRSRRLPTMRGPDT